MLTYKHQDFITDALKSIFSQKCNFDFELLIADDNSPDETEKIINDYIQFAPSNCHVRYEKHPKNIGVAHNYVWAYNQSKGSYIAHCEGDDYWIDPLKLQKQVDFLEANPQFVLNFHKVKVLQDGNYVKDKIENRFQKVKNTPITKIDLLSHGNFIHTPSVVFRNVIKEFPNEFLESPVGDYLLYLLLADYGYFSRMEEEMAVYRKGVGVYSSLQHLSMYKNILKYNICVLSMLKEEDEKKIIRKKIFNQIEQFEELIQNEDISSVDFIKRKLKKTLKK